VTGDETFSGKSVRWPSKRGVRRQNIWDKLRRDRQEDLAHHSQHPPTAGAAVEVLAGLH
jgi:hypothetical protein